MSCMAQQTPLASSRANPVLVPERNSRWCTKPSIRLEMFGKSMPISRKLKAHLRVLTFSHRMFQSCPKKWRPLALQPNTSTPPRVQPSNPLGRTTSRQVVLPSSNCQSLEQKLQQIPSSILTQSSPMLTETASTTLPSTGQFLVWTGPLKSGWLMVNGTRRKLVNTKYVPMQMAFSHRSESM